MHKEVLTEKQTKLLSFVRLFSKDFGLVGGTAVAFYIGHRQSIDFDLFSNKEFDNKQIRRVISANNKKIKHVFKDEKDEYTVLIDGVKFTFLYYPFKIKFSENFENMIKLPSLLTLGAMKAYVLGRRAKWKDYVDLYFIIKHYHSIDKLIKKAVQIFGAEFNEKIFRAQLAYFKDIDHSEKVIFTEKFKLDNKTIKKELIKLSVS